MKQKTTFFKVGLFVLLCAAMLTAGVLFVGADRIRGDVLRVETYIDESVQGLSVGSAVLRRGVNIGRVEQITFVQTEYPMQPGSKEFERFGRYVMVVVAIDPRNLSGLDRDPEAIHTLLRNQVSLGLRFKLSYQGITGISFLEADYVDPARHPELRVPWIPKNVYIPSSPSLFTSFTHALESVFLRLEQIDFEGLVAQLENTLQTIQDTLHNADIASIRESAVAMMDDFKSTNEQVRHLLAETDEPTPGNLRTAIEDFSHTLERVDRLLARHETDIDDVMKNLKLMLQNLRQFSDLVKDNPARMLFAEPPQKSEIIQ